MNLEKVLYRTLKDGGCTYGLLDDKIFLPGSPYYALSLHKECEEIIPLKDFDSSDLAVYVVRYRDKFESGLCLGTWVDHGKVYLDITQVFHKEYYDLNNVRDLATDQIAAWDLETSTLIPFDYSYDIEETLD